MADKRKNLRMQGAHAGRNKSLSKPAPTTEAASACTYQEEPQNDGKTRDTAIDLSFRIKRESNPILLDLNPSAWHLLSTDDGKRSLLFTEYNSTTLWKGDGGRDPREIFNWLLKEIKWEQRDNIIRGRIVPMPRLVAWFGPCSYTFSKCELSKVDKDKWPEIIQWMIDVLNKQFSLELNSVLLNLYKDKEQSVAWHSDDEMEMGVHPTIVSVSLGQQRQFQFRRKSKDFDNVAGPEITMNLTHGSVVVMDESMQEFWQHRVPKEPHAVNYTPRINLTFRKVFKKGPGPKPTN